MDAALERIHERLRSDRGGTTELLADAVSTRRTRWKWIPVMTAAAALLAASLWVGFFRGATDVHAVVETTDVPLYRDSAGTLVPLRAGDRIGALEIVRSNGASAILALADGSRVEMRSHSELSLEPADDGVRIRLINGSIIVNAAKQRTGHLYVQTKDVTVSVVGTVFMVNAEESGSRVAVIEGEVHVQQGATEQKLLSGQQIATGVLMTAPTLPQEIAWSRNAAAHVALLQQATSVATPPSQSTAQEPRDVLDPASIRPTRFASGGERGAGGGGRSSLRPAGEPCGDHPNSFFIKFDPARVDISDMTLYGLVTWAYDLSCRPHAGSYLLSGGPAWTKSDGYDIQANLPEGPPSFTASQIDVGGGRTSTQQTMTPRFRRMLQALLADRFKLVLRRETRNVPVYVLRQAPGGAKLTPWKEGDPTTVNGLFDARAKNGTLLSPEQVAFLGLTPAEVLDLYTRSPRELERMMYQSSKGTGTDTLIAGAKAPVEHLIDQVTRTIDPSLHRPILDRTGLTIEFNFYVRFNRSADVNASGPSVFAALEKELGLRLEPSTSPMEVYVIDRVERPTEN
jgi:uncharacterized protein (TIGR03435 family)